MSKIMLKLFISKPGLIAFKLNRIRKTGAAKGKRNYYLYYLKNENLVCKNSLNV
jgi:hypothetical protein